MGAVAALRGLTAAGPEAWGRSPAVASGLGGERQQQSKLQLAMPSASDALPVVW